MADEWPMVDATAHRSILQSMRLILNCCLFCSVAVPAFGQLPPASAEPDSRYGFLNLLDRRSIYGQFWFVEPLRAPEMDVDRELRVDYFHGEHRGVQSDRVVGELEYNFRLLTVELEVPYERESTSFFDPALGRTVHERSEGIGNLELAARHPLFQYVSPDNNFDYTLVGAFELAIPSGSSISKDTEFVPQLFQLLRVGDHVSVEASVGFSMLAGPESGGTNTFEYNVVLGYNIEHEQLPLPGISRVIPIFELNGELGASREVAGQNVLFGTAGFRVNFDAIGPLQPRIGLGYVFPIDQGARDELRWGIVTSLVFEF
jgi:hypothetical protein